MYGIAFASLCAACNLLLGNDAAEKLDGEPDASSGSSGVGASSGVGTSSGSSGAGASSSGEVSDGSGSSGTVPNGPRVFTHIEASPGFGRNPGALAINSATKRLLVGDESCLAETVDSGCAWLFTLNKDNDLGTQIIPDDLVTGNFGHSVALGPSGQIAIANPKSTTLEFSSGELPLTPITVGNGVTRVVINADYVATLNSNRVIVWKQIGTTLGESTDVIIDFFTMRSIALGESEGGFLALGATQNQTHSPSVRLRGLNSNTEWNSPNTSVSREFGRALSAKGDLLLIGSTDAADVCMPSSEGVPALTSLPPPLEAGVEFGATVAVCSANRVVIGAPGDSGAVYVYTLPPSGDWTLTDTLTPGPGVIRFGTAVACDGDLLAISATRTESETGEVYVYTLAP